MLVVILIIILIAILLVAEYKAHDCIPGKVCTHSVPIPEPNDDPIMTIDKIRGMVLNNINYVTWRQALLVGLIIPLPIIYYLKGRAPNLQEWIVVGIFVFLGAYLSSSWIYAHFFTPNTQQIERNLILLRDKLTQNK